MPRTHASTVGPCFRGVNMTFTARPIAPFSIDILSADDPASFTAGQKIPCTGSPTETGAAVSSGQITVYAGSHWRIEYSPVFTGGQFEIGLYSVTDGGYIGQSCWGTTPNNYPQRKGRLTACALILNSEISTSKIIEARIISQVSMGSRLTNSNYYRAAGAPNFRIMELPA